MTGDPQKQLQNSSATAQENGDNTPKPTQRPAQQLLSNMPAWRRRILVSKQRIECRHIDHLTSVRKDKTPASIRQPYQTNIMRKTSEQLSLDNENGQRSMVNQNHPQPRPKNTARVRSAKQETDQNTLRHGDVSARTVQAHQHQRNTFTPVPAAPPAPRRSIEQR